MMASPSFSYLSNRLWNGGRTDDARTGASPVDRAVASASGRTEIRFGAFVLVPGERMLLRNGRAVEVGSRAFDLLQLLVSSRGSIVSKDEMLDRVWPTTTVEESNLRVQIASLRKALGEDRDMIRTIPGRGYLFVAESPPGDERPVALPADVASMEERRSREDLQRVLSRLQTLQGARGAFDLKMPASREARETLRALLHSVLDEMWEWSCETRSGPAGM